MHTLNGQKVSLSPKSIADARRDYIWQKDVELMAFSGNEPLKESFLEYLAQSVTSYSPKADVEMFAIRTMSQNRHIGNCALYNISRDEGEAQLGIAIGERDCWGQGYGADAVRTLACYAFDELKLLRLRLKTLEDNARARRCFEKCGFRPCGSVLQQGRHYTLMEMNSQDFLRLATASQEPEGSE